MYKKKIIYYVISFLSLVGLAINLLRPSYFLDFSKLVYSGLFITLTLIFTGLALVTKEQKTVNENSVYKQVNPILLIITGILILAVAYFDLGFIFFNFSFFGAKTIMYVGGAAIFTVGIVELISRMLRR